jgi:hypothetical protein
MRIAMCLKNGFQNQTKRRVDPRARLQKHTRKTLKMFSLFLKVRAVYSNNRYLFLRAVIDSLL